MSERCKIRIESDGSPEGTRVLVDGKQIETTFVSLSVGLDELAQVVIHAYVDEIDIDGVVDAEIRKVDMT